MSAARVALVTGGTRGLGRAIVTRLRAGGFHVVVNYAHADSVAGEALEAGSGLPGTARLLKADVADPADVRRMLASVAENEGGLDVLVHNAATFRPMAALAPSPDVYASEMATAVNLFWYGADLIRELVRPGGRVIAISSNGARATIPGYASVGVAKAALESLVRYLAVELAPRSVTVNTIATALLDKGDEPEERRRLVDALAARCPSGRLTRPEDVADATALLCMPEAAWIQGQTIVVDGGLGLRG